jgi:hypothetical protein
LDPDPDFHQSDKLDSDPHQIADGRPKCMQYPMSLFEYPDPHQSDKRSQNWRNKGFCSMMEGDLEPDPYLCLMDPDGRFKAEDNIFLHP